MLKDNERISVDITSDVEGCQGVNCSVVKAIAEKIASKTSGAVTIKIKCEKGQFSNYLLPVVTYLEETAGFVRSYAKNEKGGYSHTLNWDTKFDEKVHIEELQQCPALK